MENKHWMYLSLWREHGGAPGMGLFSVDAETGEIAFRDKLDDRNSFGCSCFDARRNVLYVCNEEEKIWKVPYETGRIYGYKVSPKDGSLTELFHQNTYCPNPAFVSLDASGEYLVVAHHSAGGSIARMKKDEHGKYVPELISREATLQLYSLNEDGTLGELLDVQKHPVDPESGMKSSHLHSAVFSPSGNLFAVCDKGDGRVYLHAIDRERGELKFLSRTLTDVPGARPRYCVFHPTKPYFVVNHEHMTEGRMIVSSFRYTEEGAVEKVCSVDVLPPDCVVPPGSHYEQQGLCISADGNYVYTCLNGPNAIAVLTLDGESGELRLVQHAPIEGEWPRGLALVPGGKFVVASCLVSGDIASYAVEADGRLRPTGSTAKLRGGAYMSFCPQE